MEREIAYRGPVHRRARWLSTCDFCGEEFACKSPHARTYCYKPGCERLHDQQKNRTHYQRRLAAQEG